MKNIKDTINKNPKLVRGGDFLELAKKDERGVPRPTGKHRVKLLRGEPGERTTEQRGTEKGIWLYFDEKGTEVKYFVPTLGKDKKFHYLFERFKDIEEGAILDIEFVKKGLKGFIQVDEIVEEGQTTDDIPVIEEE